MILFALQWKLVFYNEGIFSPLLSRYMEIHYDQEFQASETQHLHST